MSQLTRVTRSMAQSGAASTDRPTGGLRRPKKEASELKVFHLFQSLLPELRTVVFFQIRRDDPTSYSFAMTSKEYFDKFSKICAFDPYQFADQCAVFGYEDLLTDAYQAGGPLDHKTVCLAVMQGHFFRALFKKYSVDVFKRHTRETVQASLTLIGEVASRSGHLDLAYRLVLLFKIEIDLHSQVGHLLAGGRIEQALQMNHHLMGQQKRAEASLYRELLSQAIRRGDLETALLALSKLSLDPNLQEHRDLYRDCLREGARFGVVGFIKLAYGTCFQQNPPPRDEILWLLKQIYDFYEIRPTSHHLECLMYLQTIGYLSPMVLKAIPLWADEQALNWMLENQITFNSSRALDAYLLKFSPYSKPEVVEWALAHGMAITKGVLLGVAYSNQDAWFNDLWERAASNVTSSKTFLKQAAPHICRVLTSPRVLATGADPLQFERRIRILPFQRALKMLREKGSEWGPTDEAYNQLALCLYRHNKYQAQDFVRELQMPVDPAFLAAQEEGIPADWFSTE